MGDWPGAENSPEEVVGADLSHLGLELSQSINAREEGFWEGGRYDRGVLVEFESGGKDAVAIWALRYSDTSISDNDFEEAIRWAEQNCGRYTYRNFGRSCDIL